MRSSPSGTTGEPDSEPPPEEPLAKAERKPRKYLDMAKRSQAELENFRKRAARDAAQAASGRRPTSFASSCPLWTTSSARWRPRTPEEDHLAEGVRLVHTELLNLLQRNGVTAYDPAGQHVRPQPPRGTFRPGENGAGVVLDVVEKGYQLATVLRPARVVVCA